MRVFFVREELILMKKLTTKQKLVNKEVRRIKNYIKKYQAKGIEFNLDFDINTLKRKRFKTLKKYSAKFIRSTAYYVVPNTGEIIEGYKSIRFVNAQATTSDVIELFRINIIESTEKHYFRQQMALNDFDNWVNTLSEQIGRNGVAILLVEAQDNGYFINEDTFYPTYQFKSFLSAITNTGLASLKESNVFFNDYDETMIQDYTTILTEQGAIDEKVYTYKKKKI